MALLKTVLRIALTASVGIGLVGVSLLFYQGKSLFYQEKSRQDDVTFDLTPSGKSIIFNAAGTGGNALYTLDLLTLKVHDLTHSPVLENAPTFSPDSRRIVYAAAPTGSQSTHLYTYSLADKTRKQLTDNTAVYDDMASFSADGTQIVFARASLHRPYSMGGWTWDHWDIYAMRSDGTGLHRLTSQQYYTVFHPRFAPNSKAIVYSAISGGVGAGALATDIFQVGLTGKGLPKPLTSNGHSSAPVFTPDGNYIVYICDATTPYDYEIWSMGHDGTHPVQLTSEHSYLLNPVVMPDGKHILAFADKDRAIRYDLYEFDIDGTHPRRLADSTLFDNPLHWKPK